MRRSIVGRAASHRGLVGGISAALVVGLNAALVDVASGGEPIVATSPVGEIGPPVATLLSGFGSAVAIDGDQMVIAAPVLGGGSSGADVRGKVWRFTRSAGGGWQLAGGLGDALSSDGTLGRFGGALLFRDNWLMVGAPGVDRVWVWKIAADGTPEPDPAVLSGPPGSRFGHALAIAGDTLVIGAPGVDQMKGAAMVASLSEGAWVVTSTIGSSAPTVNAEFGAALDCASDGQTIAIGAPGATVASLFGAGRTEIFARSGADWLPAQTLVAPAGLGVPHFGSAVAFDENGDRLAIGAPTSNLANLFGSAILFKRSAGVWDWSATLSGSVVDGFFGSAIAWGRPHPASPELLAVSAPGRLPGAFSPPGSWTAGSIQVFNLTPSGAPSPIVTLTGAEPSIAAPSSGFGADIAWIDDGLYGGVLAGAPDASNAGGTGVGNAMVKRMGDVAGDCDGDGIPNAAQALGGTDCNGNLVPDECELVDDDCDANGALDACESQPSIASLGALPSGVVVSLLPSKPYECAIVNRFVVPSGGAGIIDGVMARFGFLQPGATFRVAIWSDPVGSGVPASAELLFEAPVQPLAVYRDQHFAIPAVNVGPPGSSYLVGVAWTVPTFGPTSSLRRNSGSPVGGASYYLTGPLGLDLATPSSMAIGPLSLIGAAGNPRVGALLRSVNDLDGNGVIDACECEGDLDHDGVIGAGDLAALLGLWGPTGSAGSASDGDLDRDGAVGSSDLAILLGAWGACDGQ